MLVPTAQLALLLAVAVGPARASMVSMMKEGKLKFCVKQPCFAPSICLPFLGVNVCVKTDLEKCSSIKCPPKTECTLFQDVCESLPCHPKPYCVKHNPCGICLSPDHFCELLPKPVCRHVVEPTCLNKKCGFGEMCKKEPLECAYPPCRDKFSCVPIWPYHHHASVGTGDRDRSAEKSAALAVSSALGGDLGGAFNVFNGFTDKVAKAFVAGRSASGGGAVSSGGAGRAGSAGDGGDGGAGGAGDASGSRGPGHVGEASYGGSGGAGGGGTGGAGPTNGADGAGGAGGTGSGGAAGGAWRPFSTYDNGGTFSTFNGFNGFDNFNGLYGFNGFSGGEAGDAGAGSAGGSSGHSSSSHGHSFDSGFRINRPVSHAAGAISTLPSAAGGGSVGRENTELEPKDETVEEEEEEEEEEPESESDTEDEDEEEEEEPDQTL